MKLQRIQLRLLIRLQQSNHQESGFALVVAVVSIILLGALLLTAALVSKVDSSSTNTSKNSNSGFYAAEAGLNLRARDVRAKFEGFNRPSGISPTTWEDCIDASSSNNGSDDFVCDTSLTINDHQIASFIIDRTGSTPASITVPDGIFAGLNAQEYRYDVLSAALQNEGSQSVPSAILGLRFKSRLVSLFQFAMFYNNDLDFSIPPNMTSNGRIHSNNNIFLNSGSSTLTLNGIISTAGTLYRGGKTAAGTQQCSGTVRIPDKNGNSQTLACNGNNITPYQNKVTPFTTTPSNISLWDEVISTGVEPLTIPSPSEFSASSSGAYWSSADLRIVLNLDASNNPTGIEIQNVDGTTNSTATSNLLNNCPVTEKELQNAASATGTGLTLKSSGFSDGDVLTIGTDLDSNVILTGGGTSSITLRRQLGHDYQGTGTWAANTKVRKAVVSTSDTFYNYREKGKIPATGDGTVATPIRMLNVDVRALIDCAHSQNLMDGKPLNDTTEGGLVWFFSVKGPDSLVDKSAIPFSATNTNADVTGNNYGIRLYNGKSLYSTNTSAPTPQGLTVVSDQAVYIRGDYNVNRDESISYDFNGDGSVNDDDKNTWRPAAVISDTINALSNSWKMDDSDSRNYAGNLPSTSRRLNLRIPSETTMNVAFLAGTDTTGGGNGITGTTPTLFDYGTGGVNNYPRFHEHWGATATTAQACDAIYDPNPTRWCFNYRGSFVSLGEPKRVNSRFCGSGNTGNCNIYTAPIRNWDYDPRFNNAANLPPMSPRAVYLTQELFKREFTYTSSTPWQNLVALLPSSHSPIATIQASHKFSPSFTF